VNVSDCSAPKIRRSARKPVLSANRPTSGVRWGKANGVAPLTDRRSLMPLSLTSAVLRTGLSRGWSGTSNAGAENNAVGRPSNGRTHHALGAVRVNPAVDERDIYV
jgi:hypothetical protein